MAIKAGESLPTNITLKEMGDAGPKDISVGELFKGKKVVVFAVPGAFTPTCSMKHLPGFLQQADALVKRLAAKQPDEDVPSALHGKREATVIYNNLSRLLERQGCWSR